MIGGVAWFVRHVFGDSLQALRFLPALSAAAKVLLTGLLCVEMGGGAWAAALACLGVMAAPIYLITDTLFSMNTFEPLFWMGALYFVVRAARRDQPKMLLWAGVLLGLGIENKHSTAFFAVCLIGGLALSPQRRLLRSKWFWIGSAIAVLLFVPNLIWQYRHDWATYTLLQNVKKTHKNVTLTPPQFLGQQVLMLLPVSLLVWGAGLVWLFRQRWARFAGWMCVLFFALMMAMQAKNYYLAPIYPALFAAGGVWWESRKAWMRWSMAATIAVVGVVIAPLTLPVLPVEKFVAYEKWLGFEPPKTERAHAGPLPQHFGDMFGWPEMVAQIAKAYHSLPPDVRARTRIFCNNYGEAGAVDFFGRQYGLPHAICPHQGYFYFGYDDLKKGDNLIVTQDTAESARRSCADVEVLDRIGHKWAMGEEHFDLLLCKGLLIDPAEAWPRMKHWN